MQFSNLTLTAVALASSSMIGTTHSLSLRNPVHRLSRAFFKRNTSKNVLLRHMSTTTTDEQQTTTTTQKRLEDISPSYQELITRLTTVTQLRRASTVLAYDSMVLMSSSDATSISRGLQQAALAAVIHEKATDPSIPRLIADTKAAIAKHTPNNDDWSLTGDEIRILELTEESFAKDARIPSELEARKATLTSTAYTAWVKARTAGDFPSFSPTLRQCFDTAKEVAACHRAPSDTSTPLYTTMLDQFEMGMSAERIDETFAQIQTALVPLIAKVLESKTPPSTEALHGVFPIPLQKAVNRDIITTMGFDIDLGRIDESVHPFTMAMGTSDVRITSRYSEDEWYQGLAATIHEGGHAMYEQNVLDSALDIDSYLSMGAHESQSLFWERHVGMSREFCTYAATKLKDGLTQTNDSDGGVGGGGTTFSYTPEEIYGAINAVSPSHTRVEADELTYPLHVILRYEIERDVVEGRLDVDDIPTRWNEVMKSTLGVDIPAVGGDAVGCLQDIHWSGLAIGYFPTYLIGSAAAAQLAFYCEKDLVGGMKGDIERGEFGRIKDWLGEKVHRHGKRYGSLDAMFEDQLGEQLNAKYLIDYLTEKYEELYKV